MEGRGVSGGRNKRNRSLGGCGLFVSVHPSCHPFCGFVLKVSGLSFGWGFVSGGLGSDPLPPPPSNMAVKAWVEGLWE